MTLSLMQVLTLALVVALAIPFVRVLRGPTPFDRMLGVSVIGTKTVMLICLAGLLYRRLDMFVDIAVAYAMLNFIGGIVVAKYLDRTEGGVR